MFSKFVCHYHLAERGSRWRLTGTLLVYEDVWSGKGKVGVQVWAGVGGCSGTVGVPTARQKLGLLGRHARWSAQIAIFKSHTLLRPRFARLQKCIPTFLGRAALAIASEISQGLYSASDYT
jgi:hypothetical protein